MSFSPQRLTYCCITPAAGRWHGARAHCWWQSWKWSGSAPPAEGNRVDASGCMGITARNIELSSRKLISEKSGAIRILRFSDKPLSVYQLYIYISMHNHFFWTTFEILIVFVSSGYVWLLKCRFLQTQTVSRVPWWFHSRIFHPKHRNSALPLATVLIQTHIYIYKHNAASHAASINPIFLYGKGRVCKTCRNGPTDLFNFLAGSSGHDETYLFSPAWHSVRLTRSNGFREVCPPCDIIYIYI